MLLFIKTKVKQNDARETVVFFLVLVKLILNSLP